MSTRSGFSSRLGFVAAAAGSAVGLGNIWKFPYETGENGGAAFLFIYLLCTFLIGFPVMVGEIALGRKAQSNPFGTYNKLGGPNWAYVGLFGVICGVMILSFYNVVAGWALAYFFKISFDHDFVCPIMSDEGKSVSVGHGLIGFFSIQWLYENSVFIEFRGEFESSFASFIFRSGG